MPDPPPLHENPWFRVFLREGYYTMEPRSAQVAVLPTLGEGVVMVRVHRPVLGLAMLEFPAGGVEEGESPREAARRELAEETGISVKDLDRFEPLPSLSVSPDRMPAWPHLFRVELRPGEYEARGPHDGEIQEVCRMDRRQTLAAATDGRILACLPLAMLCRHFCQTAAFRESAHE